MALLLAGRSAAQEGRFAFELEGGGVWSGYNDVQIPGDVGTRFSLSEDLSTDPAAYWRLRATWRINQRHQISALAAPLRLEANGSVEQPLRFDDKTFPAGAPLEGTYRFDSYRLTWRYELLQRPKFRLAAGFTAKVRDAAIRVESGTLAAERANTGFVPLLNLTADWRWNDRWGARFEADALAAPQGRAEDVFVGVRREITPALGLYAGYRMIEGGADNDEVYTFAWLHYAAAGLTLSL